MPSARFLAHGLASWHSTGEVHGGAHGGHRAGVLGGGRPPRGSPLRVVDRLIKDEGIGSEGTPSGGISFKSPWVFLIFTPPSFTHSLVYIFVFLKAYSRRFGISLRFHYL